MTLVQECLCQKAPSGLSIQERIELGSENAKEEAMQLLDAHAPASLSASEWANLGSETATKDVKTVKNLVG